MGLFEFMICMRGDGLKLNFLSMRLLKKPFCHRKHTSLCTPCGALCVPRSVPLWDWEWD